ncbi:endonuclease/exonuclease/phosphatase family protein, partial [PVC group bacterium]|nr:endonuclease/exonuclease/phosphatase family protein [PVC group bacterium]
LSQIEIDGSVQDWPDGITHQEDKQFIYELIELPSDSCLQQLPKQQVIQLGQYTVIFSPKGKGYGVSCKKGSEWISPYEAGIVFAPTTASTKFELRVNKPNTHVPPKPLGFKPKGDFRVVSWNVEFGNLLKDKKRGARILKALQPDILLLQELEGDDYRTLPTFLSKTLKGSWTVGASQLHGTEKSQQLRSSVATWLNATIVSGIGNTPEHKQKAVYLEISFEEELLSFVSLHLRCCGGPTGEAEEQRQLEATNIRRALDNIKRKRLVIAGDWNLVGTTKPLEIIMANKLAIVDAFQPDKRLNATWSDTTSSFTPGRLDWMLYSPETLKVVNCFVLDTADLDQKTLNETNLNSEDTAKLSDHLPLVADFVLITK